MVRSVFRVDDNLMACGNGCFSRYMFLCEHHTRQHCE